MAVNLTLISAATVDNDREGTTLIGRPPSGTPENSYHSNHVPLSQEDGPPPNGNVVVINVAGKRFEVLIQPLRVLFIARLVA
jgi:hypothetical protein